MVLFLVNVYVFDFYIRNVVPIFQWLFLNNEMFQLSSSQLLCRHYSLWIDIPNVRHDAVQNQFDQLSIQIFKIITSFVAFLKPGIGRHSNISKTNISYKILLNP